MTMTSPSALTGITDGATNGDPQASTSYQGECPLHSRLNKWNKFSQQDVVESSQALQRDDGRNLLGSGRQVSDIKL